MATNEQDYFDTLKSIAKDYQTPEQLRRTCEKRYGLSFEEALWMAYENIQSAAANAIHGKRRPKDAPSRSHGQKPPGGAG